MGIRAEKLVYPGKCIAHDHEGRTVFIDGVLPGEEVEIGAWRKRKGVIEARAGEILIAAKERIVPRCPSFGVCGGCSFQHVGYDDQLQMKLGCTQEIFDHLGVRLEGIVASPSAWHYRNKVELSFGDEEGRLILGFHQKGRFDQYVRVPPCFIADEDFLPVIESIEAFARASGLDVFDPNTRRGFWRHAILRKGKRTGQIMLMLVTAQLPSSPLPEPQEASSLIEVRGEGSHGSRNDHGFWGPLLERLTPTVHSIYWVMNTSVSDAVIPETVHHLVRKATIEEHLEVKGAMFRFALSPFSFFQTNTLGAEKLYEQVLEYLDPKGDESVLDLFCGTGSIGLCLASQVKNVHGVEIAEEAIKQARWNAELNEITNATFEAVAVEKWIKENAKSKMQSLSPASRGDAKCNTEKDHEKTMESVWQSSVIRRQSGESPPPSLGREMSEYDAVIVDPPRGGMHPKVTRYLRDNGAKTIIYVSCNPTTLVRDLQVLLSDEKNPPSRVRDIPDQVEDRLSFSKGGGYRVERAIVVDMFPQTHHVECVVKLVR